MNLIEELDFEELYFTEQYDYPDPSSLSLIVYRGGMLFNYISSTFLNGYINYVNIIKAYGIHRYTDPQEKIDGKYVDKLKTVHPKLTDYDDDIFILAKSRDASNSYFYFWYDMDCSDCSIGNFVTTDDIDIVIKKFEAWVYEMNNMHSRYFQTIRDKSLCEPILLPKLSGWITG